MRASDGQLGLGSLVAVGVGALVCLVLIPMVFLTSLIGASSAASCGTRRRDSVEVGISEPTTRRTSADGDRAQVYRSGWR